MLSGRLGFIAACLAVATALSAGVPDGRFSQALRTEERAPTGLTQLNSDQLGALDALVRRDTAARSSVRADPNPPPTFSLRLTASEREAAGLSTLSAEQIARLDAAVERYQSATLARTLLAPPTYVARSARPIEPVEKKQAREIHGSFMLSYGWGSGGYSEKTGGMQLTMDDPARGFSLSVGYLESHVKGPDSGRYVEIPRRID